MSHQSTRKGKTIFDHRLPRVQLTQSELRKFHRRMLRMFAGHKHFNSSHLTIDIKATCNRKIYEFNSLVDLFDWIKNNNDPIVLDLNYKFGSFVDEIDDVQTLDARVLFGQRGENECFVRSTDPEWAERTYKFIKKATTRNGVSRYGKILQNTCLGLAATALAVFATNLFPLTSTVSVGAILAFAVFGLIATLPTHTVVLKKLFDNKLEF